MTGSEGNSQCKTFDYFLTPIYYISALTYSGIRYST